MQTLNPGPAEPTSPQTPAPDLPPAAAPSPSLEKPSPSDKIAAASVLGKGEKQNLARRRLLPHALLVGLATGALAVLFRVCLEHGEEGRLRLTEWASHAGQSGLALLISLATILMGIALLLTRTLCPEAAGSGIPHLRMVLREGGRLRWLRIIPVKFLSGLSGIVGGLCLGREGPTIQMGAALGSLWGESHLGKGTDRRSLLVTGASAGLAAAFNAPMAGILFAMEELHINIPDSAFFVAMIASVSADLLSRCLLGQTPVLASKLTYIPPLGSLPFFIVLGVVAGLLAGVFNRALVLATRHLAFRTFWPNLAKVLVAGIVVGLVGWIYPPLLGGGLVLGNRALAGQGAVGWLALMFVLRLVLSVGSYGMGTAGGIFAPLLVLGGLMGLFLGEVSQALIPAVVPEPTAFAIVGMAATFAGVVRCPLTGIVLIIEMTGHYALIMPLMMASFTASIVADELKVPPIYDALLEAQLGPRPSAQQVVLS